MSEQKTFLALDNLACDSTQELLEKLKSLPLKNFYGIKVGMELFYRFNSPLIDHLRKELPVQNIFLDLKLHDIPNTIYQAVKIISRLQIDYLTLHLSGGEKMIQAASRAIKENKSSVKILGVTYLTSLDQDDFLSLWRATDQQKVTELMSASYEMANKLANRGELDGIVLSALDLPLLDTISQKNKRPFITICPGIRSSGVSPHDQARVTTPENALELGADYLVRGREIWQKYSN